MNKNLNALDIIYKRRAVRNYKKKSISNEVFEKIIEAATYAPTAMHQEAWLFGIIQDQQLLKRISTQAKKILAKQRQNPDNLFHDKKFDYFMSEEFNIFYDADALVIIYGKNDKPFSSADCWLAAENLMLAACYLELGSCVIGLAIDALNSEEIRRELNIPDDITAFAPIILGYTNGELPAVSRKKAQIIFRS